MISGTPGLAIAAFSRAISSTVSPRYFWWSSAIWVITDTNGVITFVLSSRPPRPTSITAMSTWRAAKVAPARLRSSLQRTWRLMRLDGWRELRGPRGDCDLGNRHVVHADPLAKRDQVRRSVEADAEPGFLERRRDQRRDTPLAIGAGDVNRGELLVGIAERVEQRARGIEPELDLGGAGEEGRRGRRHVIGHPVERGRGIVLSAPTDAAMGDAICRSQLGDPQVLRSGQAATLGMTIRQRQSQPAA